MLAAGCLWGSSSSEALLDAEGCSDVTIQWLFSLELLGISSDEGFSSARSPEPPGTTQMAHRGHDTPHAQLMAPYTCTVLWAEAHQEPESKLCPGSRETETCAAK